MLLKQICKIVKVTFWWGKIIIIISITLSASVDESALTKCQREIVWWVHSIRIEIGCYESHKFFKTLFSSSLSQFLSYFDDNDVLTTLPTNEELDQPCSLWDPIYPPGPDGL